MPDNDCKHEFVTGNVVAADYNAKKDKMCVVSVVTCSSCKQTWTACDYAANKNPT